MVNQKTTIIGGLEGYNPLTQTTRLLNITLLPVDEPETPAKYSPILGRLGVHLAGQISDKIYGYFFAANMNEQSIINPLVSPISVERFDMPTNLSLDFSINNYVCVGVGSQQIYKPTLYGRDLTITREGRQWVNLGIQDSGIVFDNIYYRSPGTTQWLKGADLPIDFKFSLDGELAIFDMEPQNNWNANLNGTKATAFYRHEGILKRGSVSQVGNITNPIGIIYIVRSLSITKNQYIRFNPTINPLSIMDLQVLLDLNF